ncbi:30S ribosomal protein S6 [Tindallia californiensis]|uniref:Small ribosomal subunit protein bS6 n=1 Tax=Tindallia californiensis TaxID=159292 RepID=A0A1H3MB43_9FIRM|nr:30S ribosomal protein S6 [Tindallia californiensis]SDY73508.1 SSU ribosomal protein S6P [Tindallia californiensis]
MNKYELMYVMKPATEEAEREALLEKYKGIIEKADGQVDNIEEWGLRKLAYEIKKETEGFYMLMNFQSDVDVPKELDRNMKIADEVIRHMITRIEE